MMRGYLTVFLSLSLSVLIGFVLLLTGNAVRNAGKIRLECAADIGMNSVLAEFSIALHEKYGLLYVDASYLGKEPALSNIEERLTYYLKRNLDMYRDSKPWGGANMQKVRISEVVTAAEGMGRSMEFQAAKYIQDNKINRQEAEIFDYLKAAANMDKRDDFWAWSSLQQQIAEIELPRIPDENGEWKEIPLCNPADGVFALADSDILYILGMDVENVGVGHIQKSKYISGRKIENVTNTKVRQADNKLYLTYLFEKMGNYRNTKEDSFLKYQIEYIAQGETSDLENLKAVINRLVRWRFAVNASFVLEDDGLYGKAAQMANALHAVQLKKEFEEPVTRSILYACAYLESLSEVKTLLDGGKVEVEKNSWHTEPEQVPAGKISFSFSEDSGLSYEQYLACMIMLLSEDVRCLRSMDIMEMDIRSITGNSHFAMDFCVERYRAQILADGIMGDKYELDRTYGFY